MSDNIPFEIQEQIIKKVYDVRSLIRFRSVSKPWKSLIDSSEFIKGYGARHTHPPSHILSYTIFDETRKYICLDVETFKVQKKEFVASPLLKQYPSCYIVGVSHGLLCLCAYNKENGLVVIWNPSIQKSVGISVPSPDTFTFGFGVCPVTRDPTVVKISIPWHVEVFTLSSGVWNVIPSANLPRQSIRLFKSSQVVIDRCIYWGAYDTTYFLQKYIVSFDLIAKEFKVVDLPFLPFSVSKLRGSLVILDEAAPRSCSFVWMMEHDLSFRKLFTIGACVSKILGFRKNGEPIFETRSMVGQYSKYTLHVCDPCSLEIQNLRIAVSKSPFFMGSYKESLLLLDHSDLHIYSNNN